MPNKINAVSFRHLIFTRELLWITVLVISTYIDQIRLLLLIIYNIILLYFAYNSFFLQRHLKDLRLFHQRWNKNVKLFSYSVNFVHQRRGILFCYFVDQAEQTLYSIRGRYLPKLISYFTWHVKQDRNIAQHKNNKSCHLWYDYYVQYTMLSTLHFL